MLRAAIVDVYYINQDETVEHPCRTMTRAEARAANKADEGWFICHGKAFRLRKKVPIIVINQDRQRPAVNSCCGISKREMLANAGVPTKNDISDLEVFKAQEKVRAYPYTHDKLAILAIGCWRSEVVNV